MACEGLVGSSGKHGTSCYIRSFPPS